jgi:hypothetical protein
MKTIHYRPSIDGRLESLLSEINDTGKFIYSSDQLVDMRVKYATSIMPFLKHYGYIDENKNLLKKIELRNPTKAVYKYIKDKKTAKINKNINYNLSVNSNNFTKINLSDAELVKELRNRGYNVTATKTIEL